MARAFCRTALKVFDLGWAAMALLVCGLAWLGWVFKDAHPWTQWISFVPAPAVIGFALVWLFLTLPGRFRVLQLVVFATTFAGMFKILVLDTRWHRAPAELPEDALRIVHWNTAHGIMGAEAILRTLAEDAPDMCLITEPPRVSKMEEMAYYALGMKYIMTAGEMTFASHYPLRRGARMDLGAGLAWSVVVETPHGPLEVVNVDMVSRPNLNRHRPLRLLSGWIASNRTGHPLLVVGDFNTVRDSTALRPLRGQVRHAYEAAGTGWPYSWPTLFPLYAIDHLWFDEGIEPLHYRLKPTRFSDHKSQIFDFRMRRQPVGEG
ncbi:MAG TPA: hypothetical protein PKE55_10800 [Kiritimatiellia bacterium]|nr:hypothetical protein [Kiritimatiellia bacterium]